MTTTLQRVVIIGAGKVGTALAGALRAASLDVELRPGRAGAERAAADLAVLAVRDGQLADAVERHREKLEVPVVLHVAGAQDPEVLAPLRQRDRAVGQWHPAISFVDETTAFAGAAALIGGDDAALATGRALCARLSMRAVVAPEVDRGLYHAALALSANGMAALAASASALLERAGLAEDEARRLLAPLLSSVAHNVDRVGAEAAMSGPVRRGDATTIARHLRRLEQLAPAERSTYRASVRAQLAIARRLGEASEEALAAIEAEIENPGAPHETAEGDGA